MIIRLERPFAAKTLTVLGAIMTGAFLMPSGMALGQESENGFAQVETVVSDAGITAYLAASDLVPVVAINFAFDGGIETDPPGKEGRANLVTTLLDEGAGDIDNDEFQQRLSDLSITMRFSAGIEQVTGTLYTAKTNLDDALDLLALALTEPRFDAGPMERMRDSVAGSIRSNTGDQGWIARRAFLERLMDDHPYARPSRGTMDTLMALDVDDLRQFMDERIVRDGLTVAVAGDITPEELGPALDRAFGGLPASGVPAEVPDWQPPEQPFSTVVEWSGPQSALSLAQPGIRRDDPDYYAALVMNHILGGGGFGSRLTEEVRERRGLTYGIGSGFYNTDSVNMLMVNSSLAHDNVSVALDLIREEWARMRDDGITESELEDAQRFITGSFPLQLTSTRELSSMLLNMQLQNLGEDYIRQRNTLIEAVTVEDVNRVAETLLDPDALSVVVVGQPPEDFPADERFPASEIVDRELGR